MVIQMNILSPGYAVPSRLSLLIQVKLETTSAGISAVCQLAVNIYCFSCCKASSQHVKE